MNNLTKLYPAALSVLLPSSTLLAATTHHSDRDDDGRPNIIFVITDDQGKGDLGCLGNPYIQTPAIDNFYQDAVRLDNYHVSTTSAPSRSSIMTGRHCNRLNVFHTIMGRSIIFPDEKLLPEVLAENGYVNAMYGKWHLGDNYPNRPEDRGFSEVICHAGGGVGQGPDYWGNDYFDDTYLHNGVEERFEGYCTDIFFSEAMNFIEANHTRPFFCYLSTNAPHSPFNVPEGYLNIYKDNENLPENIARFYAMITNIDDNFRRLEQKLTELGIADNTILIFTTDNGTTAGHNIYNAGMQGHKGSPYEGGHRVPFFVRWTDGQISGGRDINNLVAHYDLLPTFVELLGLDFTPSKPLDGKSLVPLLTEESPEWESRILYMDTQRQQNLIKYRNYVVMDDNYRLINGRELYNVTEDLAQENNIIASHPKIAERLMEGYERWWSSLLDENAPERNSYIQVGSPKENPSKLMSHDMHIGKFLSVWNQDGVIKANPASGLWKVEFLESGEYAISLCRFPRESGLEINATFAAVPRTVEVVKSMPAATKTDFVTAELCVAGVTKSAEIAQGDREVTFKCQISEGKYDFYASLVDSAGIVHPSYYVYIEKM